MEGRGGDGSGLRDGSDPAELKPGPLLLGAVPELIFLKHEMVLQFQEVAQNSRSNIVIVLNVHLFL